VTALVLSIANFVISRVSARKDAARRRRDDLLHIDHLLDEAYESLWGKNGYASTRDNQKLEEAEIRIRNAMTIDPSHPRGTEYEGHVFELQGNKKAARERYARSITLDGTRARPHNCLGLLSEGDDAIFHFKRAIELAPEQASLYHHNLGKLYLAQGRLDEAEDSLRRALELRPKYARAHFELAKLLKKRQNFEEAKKEYELAIVSDSTYVSAIVELGQLLMDVVGREEDGIAWLQHAIKINPTDDYPLAMLAAIYADRKEPERALEYAEQAMAINPSRRFAGESFNELREEMLALIELRKNGNVIKNK
jgi:tetratricopeptide (TPR) repeat protein